MVLDVPLGFGHFFLDRGKLKSKLVIFLRHLSYMRSWNVEKSVGKCNALFASKPKINVFWYFFEQAAPIFSLWGNEATTQTHIPNYTFFLVLAHIHKIFLSSDRFQQICASSKRRSLSCFYVLFFESEDATILFCNREMDILMVIKSTVQVRKLTLLIILIILQSCCGPSHLGL